MTKLDDFNKIIVGGHEINKIYHLNQEIWRVSAGPGPSVLIAGDMEAGFYGEFPASEFITGDELASLVGVQVGVSVNSLTNWLKFSFENKILFVSKKVIRHTISPNELAALGLISGSKTVTIGDYNYKVRLLRGASSNPATGTTLEHLSNSEWNRLILPLSDKAPDGFMPTITSMPTANFGTNFTETELGIVNPSIYTFCQEDFLRGEAVNQLSRGYSTIDYVNNQNKQDKTEGRGWRPVLELI